MYDKVSKEITLQDGSKANIVTPQVIQVANSGYQYQYNGKEWQDELGLALYDYGARNYDAALGRWMNLDPLAEMSYDLTPYRFSGNNPVVFFDKNGLWEFKECTDENDQRVHILLSKTKDDDNLDSFMKEIGLNERQIRKHLFGGDENAMNAFFGGDESSINVSELSGKYGDILHGMETALNEGNSELKEAFEKYGDGADVALNNCWNTVDNLASTGNVNTRPLEHLNSATSFFTSLLIDKNFDNKLVNNYINVSIPQFGDIIRYSSDGGLSTTHGTIFLLKNDNGIQVFTKNGFANSQPYKIMLQQSELLSTNPDYGEPKGIKGYIKINTDINGKTTTSTVNHSNPYYRY